MKFHEYITQRRAFGRTPWLRAILIWGLSGGLIVAGVWILVERDWWGLAPLLVGIGVRCIMGFGTKNNWETDKAREEKGPGSPHVRSVCENCNPPCYRSKDPEVDGSPLTDIEDWYMAAYHVDRERAQREIANARLTGEVAVLSALHAKYLMHPKFKKFRK